MALNKPTVEEVSNFILDSLRERYGENIDAEVLRCALGLSLTSVHTALIETSKYKEQEVESFIDTIGRLCMAAENKIKEHNLDVDFIVHKSIKQ